MKHIFISIFILLFVWACTGNETGANESTAKPGVEALYKTHCAICHGADGRKGMSGAGILPDSELDLAARIAIIKNGKGNMMAYQGLLTDEQIEALAAYTTTFK